MSWSSAARSHHVPKKVRCFAKDAKDEYSDTVLLPQTSFSQRANAKDREPEIQQWWDEHKIYERILENAKEKEPFTLHDGPPYANGDLHIGHALNKILKDFINRYYILRGRKVEYIPGWDCHGLPIELKVLQFIDDAEKKAKKAAKKNGQEIGKKKKELSPLELRAKARDFAVETAQAQKLSFRRYGIWGSWDTPYLTLHKEYEAAQLEVFTTMFERGYIYRGLKPVWFSPSSQTALAEAELEYPENHVSRSVFMAFHIKSSAPCLYELQPIDLAIWTTTPWTLPANLAVSVNADIQYAAVDYFFDHAPFRRRLVVAESLIDQLGTKLKANHSEKLKTFSGADLAQGTFYTRPFNNEQGKYAQVLVGGDYVTADSGTGLVHTAPGHGYDDYQTGLAYGLNVFSPVDDRGRYTAQVGDELKGLNVLTQANEQIFQLIQKDVLCDEMYAHRYPYDWRTKKPVIMRATSQWFASIKPFRNESLDAIDQVSWVPAVGEKRISSMVLGREDWCISRQRSWGVPIPVFYHKDSGQHLMNKEILQHVINIVREYGSDAWWSMSIEELLPESFKDQAHNYVKGNDTMDVWFDSGTSWASVLKRRGLLPADLYLEGSDQHRGWFQSSLLTSVAVNAYAPYKTVLTHGFVLDEKGMKMSKSLGNVIDPKEVINGGKDAKKNPPYGADVLRLWVASVDFTSDVKIGPNTLKQIFEQYRKIRNTFRYMIGNVYDFTLSEDQNLQQEISAKYEQFSSLDKWMLGSLSKLEEEVFDAYKNFQFSRVTNLISRFCVTDLSAFYLDVAKDRLYISPTNAKRRRDCQLVLAICLDTISKLVAPILPHIAEELWHALPYKPGQSFSLERGSVFDTNFDWDIANPSLRMAHYPKADEALWSNIQYFRDEVNKALEIARRNNIIGASVDAALDVFIYDDEHEDLWHSLKKLCDNRPFEPHCDDSDW
eukprot:CAMPEP_0197310934 /NCGR_PEP_ID=MMETSP0891-20130614/9467_1 /TAXON_ID=44058 ORGANISM="Aureoumbra lagunensis, Strain CCMP1510" /NCGR_SAMPLE_ID=MMETSP0891 /ASSEMBLY_ACC=CAM_ASM_000534 /LENGTH=945 /DNA_ID=CAMNT_0042796811 /DNA_START=72 /DNA_END=2906 /DNA_ORIENTATION=-